jgi:hypothetical protein
VKRRKPSILYKTSWKPSKNGFRNWNSRYPASPGIPQRLYQTDGSSFAVGIFSVYSTEPCNSYSSLIPGNIYSGQEVAPCTKRTIYLRMCTVRALYCQVCTESNWCVSYTEYCCKRHVREALCADHLSRRFLLCWF